MFIFNFNAPGRIGMPLALLALLAGCAGNNPAIKGKIKPAENQKVKIQAGKPAATDVREPHADFDAAMGFIKAGEYDRGIELLNKVTEIKKNNPAPYINLAMAYGKAGNLKLAEKNIKLALKIDPDSPVANNEYAMLSRKTGRFREARQLYEKAVEKYPGFYMAHRNLGILCDLYMRDYECAIKHYGIYSGGAPDDKTVGIWIADVQKRLTK